MAKIGKGSYYTMPFEKKGEMMTYEFPELG